MWMGSADQGVHQLKGGSAWRSDKGDLHPALVHSEAPGITACPGASDRALCAVTCVSMALMRFTCCQSALNDELEASCALCVLQVEAVLAPWGEKQAALVSWLAVPWSEPLLS